MKNTTHKIAAMACLTAMSGITPAFAATFVYEGFNYGVSSMPIDGVAVGGGATGLSGSYTTATGSSGNDNVQVSNYIPTSLSFSNVQTSGGALYQSVEPKIDSVKEYAYSHASFSASATGDIYQSMLVNVSASAFVNTVLEQDPSNSGISELRVQDTASIIGNGSGSMATYSKRGSQTGVKVGSQYTINGPIGGSQEISLGETYLLIMKYTNVGGTGGTATTWVMDVASFDNWQVNGGLEGTLDDDALFVTSNTSGAGTIVLDSSKSMRIATSEFSVDFNSGPNNYSNTGELSATYDEVRYGNSLGDVIVVPEPSHYALATGCTLLGFLVLRRRR